MLWCNIESILRWVDGSFNASRMVLFNSAVFSWLNNACAHFINNLYVQFCTRRNCVIGSIEYRIVHIYVSVNWTVKFSSSSWQFITVRRWIILEDGIPYLNYLSQWFHHGKRKQPRIFLIPFHWSRALLSSSLLLPKDDFRFCLQFFQLMWPHLYIWRIQRMYYSQLLDVHYAEESVWYSDFEMPFFRRETCSFHHL